MNRTLTRRIAFIETFDLIVGVDLAKRKNVAVMVDQHLRQRGRCEFYHDRAGYEQFTTWLRRRRPGLENNARLVVGMEPTNDYWYWLAGYLQQIDRDYRLVNPFTVKKNREGTHLDYGKDDRRDALTIARLLREGQFTETQMPQGVYAEMRYLEQTRWRIKDDLGRAKTLLRQYSERLFPELNQAFCDLTGKTVSALLKRHAQPADIVQMSWTEFVHAIREDFLGQRLALKQLRAVYELAPNSIGVRSTGALQMLIDQQLEQIALLQTQKTLLEETLLAQFYSLPHAPFWLSLGMGHVTTALIAAELGDPSHFRHAGQWVKLAGIQPTHSQSGQYRRQRTPMSHKGRARLRTYLFFATLRIIRWDKQFRACYDRKRQGKDRPFTRMQAVGQMMNKLLHILWALYRKQVLYEPHRLG